MRHDRGREARAWGARGALTADLDRANVRQVARIDAGGRLPALAPAHVRADGDVHHRPRLAGRVAGAPDDVAVQEAAVDDVQRVGARHLRLLGVEPADLDAAVGDLRGFVPGEGPPALSHGLLAARSGGGWCWRLSLGVV